MKRRRIVVELGDVAGEPASLHVTVDGPLSPELQAALEILGRAAAEWLAREAPEPREGA